MKKLMKRTAASLLSLTMLGAALPFEAGPFSLPGSVLTAQAENTGSTATLDETTGTLTIRGYVDKADVQEYSMDNRVKSVYAEPGTVFPADSSELFMGLGYATNFDLSNADTSNVTTMADMFNSCESVKTINAKGWDTSKVTDLSWICLLYTSPSPRDS